MPDGRAVSTRSAPHGRAALLSFRENRHPRVITAFWTTYKNVMDDYFSPTDTLIFSSPTTNVAQDSCSSWRRALLFAAGVL